MLPGLVLTVGLLSQSLAGLVSTAPRNPTTPRFVNVGDDIVQSDTARPVPPHAACLPPPAPAAPEPQRVIVDVHVQNDAPDMAASEPEEVPLDQSAPYDQYAQYAGGVTYVPVVVHHASRRAARANPYAPYYPPIRTVRTVGRASPHPVMLPALPTVVLPPAPAASHPR